MDPDATYKLCMYPWKGVKVNKKVIELPMLELEESRPTAVVVQKVGREYTIKTPVVVTTFEEKAVSLSEFVGLIICQTRTARGLTQNALSNLTGNKVSASSISQIETAGTNPILSSLEDISEALGLHITDLFPPKH
jgi:DNA-binding XRE family transcriptional regulator